MIDIESEPLDAERSQFGPDRCILVRGSRDVIVPTHVQCGAALINADTIPTMRAVYTSSECDTVCSGCCHVPSDHGRDGPGHRPIIVVHRERSGGPTEIGQSKQRDGKERPSHEMGVSEYWHLKSPKRTPRAIGTRRVYIHRLSVLQHPSRQR